ncbi:glycerol-3-phosphate acyltransferase 2, mitochondrial isoform X2 [Alligator sinensis]|uniref:Glycerol-3-phosphate acyltransferase 2, mitochondrial isoform X2 n=1 Tax=Alligator sinensis TaxID=38654 RepID=A0A1U7RXZ9_ALLSI|nr:glycerol-3-phosphate acyltransferase 2, mitochondrial isoform X2 [Alligator sinensis]
MALTPKGYATHSLQAEEKLNSKRKEKAWLPVIGMKLEISTPFLGVHRPFVGRCCQICTPRSWESLFHKHLLSLGFHNAIRVTEEDTRYRGWLVRRLCHFLAISNWKIPSSSPGDFEKKICHSKRVQDVMLQQVPQARGDSPILSQSPAGWRSEVLQVLSQVQAPISLLLVRLCSWALLKVLTRLFHNVLLHKGQVEMVRKAAQVPDVPLVFLSTHKSCLDGLLLPFLLFSQGLGVPRVTWEYQAFTPPLRALLSQLGGIFLPLEAEHVADRNQGALSRAVLTSYAEELLKSRQHLLIFLEKPFSSAPHLSAPGWDWLALVLGAFQAGAVPDVLLVPVGISYDMAPDVCFGSQASSARPLSFWSCLLPICRALGQGFGCVRVDFAQPFSLQEYVANNCSRQSCIRKSLEELLLPVVFGKRTSLMDCEKSEEGLLGLRAAVALKAEEQILVGRLGLHSLTAGVSCSAVTAVGIMSALLLHKHREGVFLSRLMSDFAWLTEEILLHQRDVAFSGQLRALVLHSLTLLRGCVSLHQLSLGDVLVAPQATEPAMRQLSLHGAALLPIFMAEAVGACAINALLVEMLPFLGPTALPADIILSQQELQEKTLVLVQLLPRDFLLLQPCQPAFCYCQDVLDKLIQCGLLVAEEASSERPACDTSRRRFSGELMWKETGEFSDDSDYDEDSGKRCFKISQLDNCFDFFLFLCSLLSPVLRTYERAAAFLAESCCPQPEPAYTEKLQGILLRKAREDGSFECVNRSMAVSSVRTFKELGVLQELPTPAGPKLYLSESFSLRENQESLKKFIQQFIYC